MAQQTTEYQTFLEVGMRLMLDSRNISLDEAKTVIKVLEDGIAKVKETLKEYENQPELFPNTVRGLQYEIQSIESILIECKDLVSGLEYEEIQISRNAGSIPV